MRRGEEEREEERGRRGVGEGEREEERGGQRDKRIRKRVTGARVAD